MLQCDIHERLLNPAQLPFPSQFVSYHGYDLYHRHIMKKCFCSPCQRRLAADCNILLNVALRVHTMFYSQYVSTNFMLYFRKEFNDISIMGDGAISGNFFLEKSIT